METQKDQLTFPQSFSAMAEAAAIELFAIFSSNIFCFSSIGALNVLLIDWISEISGDMFSLLFA
jgi:hypothetical protein